MALKVVVLDDSVFIQLLFSGALTRSMTAPVGADHLEVVQWVFLEGSVRPAWNESIESGLMEPALVDAMSNGTGLVPAVQWVRSSVCGSDSLDQRLAKADFLMNGLDELVGKEPAVLLHPEGKCKKPMSPDDLPRVGWVSVCQWIRRSAEI